MIANNGLASLGIFLLVVMAFAAVLTGIIRRDSIKRNLIDVPNARSSHAVPTPRGGGLSIVFSVLAGLLGLWWLEVVSTRLFVGLGIGGALIAAIGYMDDRGDIPARSRFCVHLLAAVILLVVAGDLPSLFVAGIQVQPGMVAVVVAVVLIVWIINLYNFMDGVDGIAGAEAVTVCAGAATLLWLVGHEAHAILALMYAAASLGFLVWNWPRARIFMGDGGSGFLGFSLAALALFGWVEAGFPFWCWLILLGVFIVDASVTLLRRLVRRERWYEAHCNHAYQHAARRFGSHGVVTGAVIAINLVWLLPVAAFSAYHPQWGAALLVVAYLPLLGLVWRYHAGVPAESIRQ